MNSGGTLFNGAYVAAAEARAEAQRRAARLRLVNRPFGCPFGTVYEPITRLCIPIAAAPNAGPGALITAIPALDRINAPAPAAEDKGISTGVLVAGGLGVAALIGLAVALSK